MDDGTPTWMSSGYEYERNANEDLRIFVCGDRNALFLYRIGRSLTVSWKRAKKELQVLAKHGSGRET